jgi:hypothetical protein
MEESVKRGIRYNNVIYSYIKDRDVITDVNLEGWKQLDTSADGWIKI